MLEMTRDELVRGLNEVHEGPWTPCPKCKKPVNRKGCDNCGPVLEAKRTGILTAWELANFLLQLPNVEVKVQYDAVIREIKGVDCVGSIALLRS